MSPNYVVIPGVVDGKVLTELPGHKDLARPAATAAIIAAAAGLAQAHVETLPSPARQWYMNGWRTTR